MAHVSTPWKWVWTAIAAGVVAVLVISLLVARSVAGGGRFAAPSGLTARVNTGYVTVSWNKVSGAASYLVMRDGVAAFSGAATTFDDHVASNTLLNDLMNPSPNSYTVQAISSDGAVSPFSAAVTVIANRSWAEYSADMALLGQFMPSSPGTTGWEDMTCSTVNTARDANRGSDPKGNGQPGMRFGVACNVPGSQPLSVLSWFMNTPDEINAAWAAKTAGGRTLTWNSGSAATVTNPDGNNIFLRFSDPKLSLVMISIGSSTPNAISTTDLLAKANTITTAG